MIKKLAIISVIIALGAFGLTACAPKEDQMNGQFYTLQEAYDQELLTMQDLKSIAYYHGALENVDGTFVPSPKNPETLSAEVSKGICRAFYAIYVEPHVDKYDAVTVDDAVTIDDVEILGYYGTYNEAIAIRMKDNFGSAGEIREVTVAGITFEYNSVSSIMLWKAN